MSFLQKLTKRVKNLNGFQNCVPAYSVKQEIAIPIFEFDLTGEVDASQIADAIYAYQAANPVSRVSSIKAWHSGFTTHFHPSFSALCESIHSKVLVIENSLQTGGGFDMSKFTCKIRDGWAIIYKENEFTEWHNHGSVPWACVYYAAAEDNPAPILFKDINSNCIEIIPKTNSLIVFPGYTQHSTLAHAGNQDRVVFAANVFLYTK